MQAARNKMARELAWVRKQPKARESKSKSRVEAFQKLSDRVAEGTAAEKERGSVSISAGMQRLGSKLLICSGVSVDAPGASSPRRVIHDFTYEFLRKDRIGIVGPNGAGKTSFLKALQGQLPLAAGSIDVGETLLWGHYEQQGLRTLNEDLRVLELVQQAVARAPGEPSPDAAEKGAATLLSKFNFPPRRWKERVAKLSGGERRRLQMLQVLARQPNVLLLDEPTNDLDLDTIQVLEDFLVEEFSGVLLVVSHDRYFLDKCVDHLFVLPGDGKGEVLDWQASFSEYVAYRDREEQEARQRVDRERSTAAAAVSPEPSTAANPKTSAKPKGDNPVAPNTAKALSNFEREQLARFEAEMEALTAKQADLQRSIDTFDPARNGYSELSAWTEQVGDLSAELEEVELKWLALAERADL